MRGGRVHGEGWMAQRRVAENRESSECAKAAVAATRWRTADGGKPVALLAVLTGCAADESFCC